MAWHVQNLVARGHEIGTKAMKQVLLGLFIGLILGTGLCSMLFFYASSGGASMLSSEDPIPSRLITRESELSVPATESTQTQQAGISSATPVAISDGRIAAVLAQTVPRESTRPRGDGVIKGLVRDQAGVGVANVRVRALAQDGARLLRKASDVGAAPRAHTVEASLRSAAKDFTRQELRTFETHTDATGSFYLENLAHVAHTLRLERSGYMIISTSQGTWMVVARPGEELEFLAKPIIEVPVSVRHGDGTPAIGAIIRCSDQPIISDAEWSQELFGQGRSEFSWSPTETTMRLPAGTVHLKAYGSPAGEAAPRQAVLAEARSESRHLVVNPGSPSEPLVLELLSKPGIRGVLTELGSRSGNSAPRVMLMALEEGEQVDLNRLRHSEQTVYLYRNSEFLFIDLTAGHYAVGVSREWGSPISVHRVVEVSHGITRCDLELPPLGEERVLRVTVLDPDGAITGGVSFGFSHRSNGRSSSSSGGGTPRDNSGAHLYRIPTGSQTAYYDSQSEDDYFALLVRKDGYGERNLPLSPGQEELVVQLEAEARVHVNIAGYVGSGLEGMLEVMLYPVEAEEAGRSPSQDYESESPDGKGNAFFSGLAPGNFDIVLSKRRHYNSADNWDSPHELDRRRLVLRSGANDTNIMSPTLYPLDVFIPDAEEGQRVILMRASNSGERHTSQGQRSTDSSGNVHFEFLAPGGYLLKVGDIDSQPLTVPCGTVTISLDG